MEQLRIIDLMRQGGLLMWPIFVLLAITIAVAVERTFTFGYLFFHKEQAHRKELEFPLTLFDFIANLAPIIGFLGTIIGMIGAFRSVSNARSMQLQIISAGLYEALYTTAFGLTVSIIATLLGYVFEVLTDSLCANDNET